MTIVAIAESLNGNSVQWLEKISEAQYRAESSPPWQPFQEPIT
jgi:hypothetical protein